MRAITNGGMPKFILGAYGEHSMRLIPKQWNDILPESYRVDKPTGHSGRTTGVSLAMNNGGDSQRVSIYNIYNIIISCLFLYI
jgi:hypothetical protein